jgi:thiol-disulfide isomerase/thioredoxin
MKNYFAINLILIVFLSSCESNNLPREGIWRATLTPDSTRKDLEIPFRMEIMRMQDQALSVTFRNAGEEIRVQDVVILDDSIHLRMPVFEGTIDARVKGKSMDGSYTHRAGGRSWSVPFHAGFGIPDRFPRYTDPPSANITGRWEVTAGAGDQAEKQIAEFTQEGGHLTGTFLTTTGDYRYLEGKMAGNKMMLSGFDGAHALIFEATLSAAGTLDKGILCGGPSWKTEWHAVRNDTVTLPDPTTLTFLKPGYEKFDFAFPDLDGKTIRFSDPEFLGKPAIVQVMGSWCPNCMDEARFFTGLFNEFKDQGLNLFALCYESADRDQSIRAIRRFRSSLEAGYTFLYAGESNKRKAGETLPMLNRILSYPTSIFIGRDGKVVKIFTGFSGPGTGKHYEKLTGEMRKVVGEMMRAGEQ